MTERIIIFDTTLRDGEQSPGAALSVPEKVEIARQLEKLNVDVIEAGFPVSSPAQFDAVRRIAGTVEVGVAALARAHEKDILAARDALKEAVKPRIHTFSSTSDYHILGKFGDARYGATLSEKRQTVICMSVEAVQLAKSFCDDVEFSAEDAGRTDDVYLAEVIAAAIEAGATTVNIPDTTGYTLPGEYRAKIEALRRRVPHIDRAVISVHCHNDLGLAVANSLAGVQGGARQIECTINGIGERAGNAALEEIVMALKVRGDRMPFHTGIVTREIYNTSRMVSGFTGMIVQPNKAVVGANAFAHESGIHQDGMLKSRETYEIMTPEEVGVTETRIVLGRHSGRHGLKARLLELGYTVNEEELNRLYSRFTDLADKKKEIFDDDLRVLMGDSVTRATEGLTLDFLQVHLGTLAIPTAVVRLRREERVWEESATGDGPVAAVFNAIERALDHSYPIESYQVRSVTSGRGALGEALLRIRVNGIAYNGRGVSTDVVEASARAFIMAINHVEQNQNITRPIDWAYTG